MTGTSRFAVFTDAEIADLLDVFATAGEEHVVVSALTLELCDEAERRDLDFEHDRYIAPLRALVRTMQGRTWLT